MDDLKMYQQAGCVPFRVVETGFEVCLITSSRSRRWGFPKGIIDPGETPAATALKESWEEAGLRGRIAGESLGSYRHVKSGRELHVLMWPMEVERCDAVWPESNLRDRRWESFEAALKLLCRPPLRRLLRAAEKRLPPQSR